MSERRDPHERPADPAGTRPKVHPDELRPREGFRALPAGEEEATADGGGGETTGSTPGEAEAAPVGEVETGASRLPERAPAASPPARSQAPAPSQHAPRFQLLLGAFGALGVAAAAVAVTLALAPKSKPGPPWSTWHPAGDVDVAVQIAQHVAPEYQLSPGHLLVNVTGGPQEIGGQPVVVALRPSGAEPIRLEENGVFYQLCGSGPNCSISGKPSTERGLLVSREALELALYTLHYDGTTNQVIVTFPPAPTKAEKGAKSSSSPSTTTSSAAEGLSSSSHIPSRVLLFRREDLASELASPLDATLAPTAPTVKTVASAPESQLVNHITARLIYDSTLIPETQSNPVLLLQSPSVGS